MCEKKVNMSNPPPFSSFSAYPAHQLHLSIPYSAANSYIQINTDFPVFIKMASYSSLNILL